MTPASHVVPMARPAGAAGPRRSLILAGGGMRVAYQAGVLQALHEAGLTFDHADGTSGGTINLAMLFSGVEPREMCARWRSLRVRDFVSFMPPLEYLRADRLMGMGDADGIVQKVFPHLGIDAARINAATGMQGTFNVCNFTSKTNRAVPHQEVTRDLLVAGISLPAFMPAVRVGTDDYVDSVWIKDANLMEAIRRGAEEIWLVWCIGNSSRYRGGAFHQYVHMIELSANGALFAELDYISELNQRIARGDSPFGQRGPIKVKVIHPTYPLPLDPSYYLGQIDGATLVALGYADAWRRLAGSLHTRTDHPPPAPRGLRPRPLARDADDDDDDGDPLDATATRMKDPDAAVAWNEHFSGTLTWTAARVGRELPIELTASVFVQDLPRFIADPAHTAPLYGSVMLGGAGAAQAAALLRDGSFRCGDGGAGDGQRGDGSARGLTYQAAFDVDGAPHVLLAGRDLKGGPGARFLGAITSVAVTVHAGTDAGGVVVATGTLRTSLSDWRTLARSFQAIEPDDATEAARTLARFGQFLFGELYDLRVRERKPWWKFW